MTSSKSVPVVTPTGLFLRDDFTWQTGGVGVTVSINLTNAQLLALNSSPVTLIAAQGSNTIIQFLFGFITLDNAAALYTTGAAVTLFMNGVQAGNVPSAFFTADGSASKGCYVGLNQALGSAIVNQPLILRSATDFTGGNAANKATITITYIVRSSLPV